MPEIVVVGLIVMIYAAIRDVPSVVYMWYINYLVWKTDRKWKQQFKTPP